jgi:Ser/Thr protein kinase RdoA (MazF antagonist)
MLEPVLTAFGLGHTEFVVQPFGSGLIHRTYLVKKIDSDVSYILQQVNQHVFKKPGDIAHNIHIIGKYLNHHHPRYLFTLPILTRNGDDYAIFEDSYYRLFSFIYDTHTVNVCQTAEQAFEAARQFGRFTAHLTGLRMDMLRYTIPGFHDLEFRYLQFEDALEVGNKTRIEESVELVNFITQRRTIADQFQKIKQSSQFKLRVTHHDTKINNVLLDPEDKGVCVIDLDTVMPGYFISDIGDMMRTYLSPANEEERDYNKIVIRDNFFEAIMKGYLTEMKDELTIEEKQHLIYAGKFMIYMQAIRFLADHLRNDTYYGARYEGHNFVRAGNQITLLRRVEEKEADLNKIASRFL